MKRIVSAAEMKKCDSHMIHEIGVPSLVLMERAADSCVRETLSRCPELSFRSRILCVCGSGNNGGDGFAVARICTIKGYSCDIWFLGNISHMTEETRTQYEICEKLGIHVFTEKSPDLTEYAIVFDAIFGIGLSRPIEGHYLEAIKEINRVRDLKGMFVTAVDIPSGIAADTGEVMGDAIQADLTVTMQFLKPGLLLPPGTRYAGETVDAEIGIAELPSSHPMYLPEKGDLKNLLPKRSSFGNKGTFGKVLLVSGSKNMAGASMLASKAALRSGAGMVKLLTVEDNRNIIQETLPEVMLSTYSTSEEAIRDLEEDLKWCTVAAAGSGMGNTERTYEIVKWLLAHCEKPLVLDADALNVLDDHLDLLDGHISSLTITPHMGEMSRLSGVPVGELKKDPIRYARSFAEEHHLTCILKDARTVTACEDGTCYINVYGNDGMATAGSGDTLTGITASLTAQGSGAYTAVLLHALAGDLAALKKGKAGMTAGDMITSLSGLYTGCEE